MSLKLTSITLNTAHLEDMLKFYKIIGLDFAQAKVDKGSQVYRATLGGCEFSLYSIQTTEKKSIPTLQLSFSVQGLDEKVQAMGQLQNAMCILDPTLMPDGKKAIVLDPDGHSVELLEY
jgi:hypothetical protein